MIYQYVVTLKNRFRDGIDRFSILACAVSSLLFLEAYFSGNEKLMILVIGGVLVLLLTAFNTYRLLKLKKRVRFNYLLMLTGLVWAGMPLYPWLSIPLILMGLVEHQAKKDLEIGFSDAEIVFNSIPRKHYSWGEFTNIVLKDNLLTLDYTNNRLFQRETVDDEDDDCEEDEFNNYCRTRLNASL
ncbi:MAG: hypothetical protein JNK20_16990 [Flavipsychrobacter sp.]|jgi:hypothetical protein|nr:hypothetical protein [Flavipsychrobacter sp.]